MSVSYTTVGSVAFNTTYISSLTLSSKIGTLVTSGSYLTITATSLQSLFTSNAFTVEFFVYFIPTSGINMCLFNASQSTAYYGFAINAWTYGLSTVGDSTPIAAWISTNQSTANSIVLTGSMPNSAWRHIALVNNGTTFYLFINGVLAQSSAGVMPSIASWVNNWVLGSEQDKTVGNYLSGGISNLRISNIARYTTSGFIPPTAYFTYDDYTVYLNTFNQSSGTSWSSTSYTMAIPCLCMGMLLRTPYGDTPVEKLRIGDLVISQDGRTVPIIDIARRTVRGDYYNIPFRIPSHYFAENAPYADVLISPNHIVYYGKVIVPCQTSGLVDETALLGKDFEYFNVALPNYATDKMMCQGLEVDSWNTKEKLL
jgi:hypothetical protein